MGEILTKIKRNYKTHQIKKEKSESISEEELKEILGDLYKELEKGIKEYETEWKKANINTDVKKEFTSFESYYKKLKYTFLACQKNIDKTVDKIDKMADILDKMPEKIGKAKDTEKSLDKIGKIEKLHPDAKRLKKEIATIIGNLKELRNKQKEIMQKDSGLSSITPKYLKNKLKAIKKSEKTTDSRRIKEKANKLKALIDLLNTNANNFDKSCRDSYIDGRKYYFNKFKEIAKAKAKKKNNKNVQSFKDDELSKFFKTGKTNIIYFSLGFINCFYANSYKSSKELYQEVQKLRQETDKITDSKLKKVGKLAAILIPGLIGMVASVMSAFSSDLILFISALGFIVSQLGYSTQETIDGSNAGMSGINKQNDLNIKEALEELEKLEKIRN
ncbi:MAG: hypothetical protein IJG00_00140 [Clostridia bacterium]|nr:hypothetical protein [Clostridia bacterium]